MAVIMSKIFTLPDIPELVTVQFLASGGTSNWVGGVVYDGGEWKTATKAKTVELLAGTVLICAVPEYGENTGTVFVNDINMESQMYTVSRSGGNDLGFSGHSGNLGIYEYILTGPITIKRGSYDSSCYIVEL